MKELSYVEIKGILRMAGWRVGAHNDFHLEAERVWRTFWMWTHPESGRYVEAEGDDDFQALCLCLEKVRNAG